MVTETPGAATAARPWLLVLLGVAVIAFVVMQFGGGAADRGTGAATQERPGRQAAQPVAALEPAELAVRLEALAERRPTPAVERNPFRFQPRGAPRPVLNGAGGPAPGPQDPVPIEPVRPPAATQFPPIPLKFIGIVEAPGIGKVAALSDCRFTFRGREGDVIDGRYRLVRIGVESVVIEHVDGTGRTTVRLSGQECVGR